MEESETKEDLTNNPFVALFGGNVEAAAGFASASRVGLDMFNKQNPLVVSDEEDEGCVDDTMSASEDEHDVSMEEVKDTRALAATHTETNKLELLTNDLLERIFLFTVDFEVVHSEVVAFGGLPSAVVKLLGLEGECRDNNKQRLLTTENLSQALYERLQREEFGPLVVHRPQCKGASRVDAACETRLVFYLSSCFCRILSEQNVLRHTLSTMASSGKLSPSEKADIETSISNVFECSSNLLLSFSGTILLQPEIFPGGSNMYVQLYELLVSAYSDPDVLDFVMRLISQHAQDDEDITAMFSPVLDLIWASCQQFDILHPTVFPVLNILVLFRYARLHF